MKLIVEIPEAAYELLQNDGVDWLGAEHILDAVSKSTPLEKYSEKIIAETIANIWGKLPCGDVINRKAVLDALLNGNNSFGRVEDIINEIPSASLQNDILNLIRSEIKHHSEHFINDNGEDCFAIYEDDVLAIIDKYIKGDEK